MHEMSIAVAIVEQVERAAREHGATAVEAIRLQVGELAGVVPQALEFCFELACAGTVLAGAALGRSPGSSAVIALVLTLTSGTACTYPARLRPGRSHCTAPCGALPYDSWPAADRIGLLLLRPILAGDYNE